jgi:hypothetical protein
MLIISQNFSEQRCLITNNITGPGKAKGNPALCWNMVSYP